MSSGPANSSRQSPFLSGFVALAFVALGFVTYVRKGAVFTYEARREVAVVTAAGTPLLDVHAAATRLEQTAFDARLVERLAAATHRSMDAATTDALEVRFGVGKPGHIEIICRDGEPQPAGGICDEVGRTAVASTSEALAGQSGPNDPAATRLAALRELARFAQAHPTVVTAAPSARPPQDAEAWQKLWKAAREAPPTAPETSSTATVHAELVGPALAPHALGGGPSSVLVTGFLSALGVGLVVFGLQRGKRSRPPTAELDEREHAHERSRQSVSSRPPPRLTSSAPPPRATSSAPPPKLTSSAPPPRVSSSAPPPKPTSSAPPPHPTSSAPPPKPSSSFPPAVAKASPLPPHASPLTEQAPATARGYGPASHFPAAAQPAPAAMQASPPPPTAEATAGAPGEKTPTTILPPAEKPAQDAPTARRTASGQLRYEATSLPSQALAPVQPTTRTTQLLGSIRPPSEVAAPVIANDPETPSGSVSPRSLSRYSFVSTPPPAGGDPVRPHDLGQDWQPDPVVDPAPCRALCRELFAFGVEHCFVIGVTSLAGVDQQKSEFASSLALALGASGHARVLLIDADLDRPTQHRLMRAEMPPGTTLSRQLQARMTRRDVGHWSVLRASRSLHLLVDGSESTPGLILSRTFEECVRALRAYYDFIVLDGPPGSRESACCALDGVIDGLVILCTDERRAEVPQVSRFFTTKRFSKAIRATT